MPKNRGNTKANVINFLNKVPKILSGEVRPRTSNDRRVYAIFWGTVIHSMFDSIYNSYLERSEGKADDRGRTWNDLAASTKAYKKNRKGHLAPNQRRKANNKDTIGLLTPAQHKKWKHVFGRAYGRTPHQATSDDADRKAYAAKKAWWVVKNMGAETLYDVLKDAKMPIMKNTGYLLASLRPGKVSRVGYTKSHPMQVVKKWGGEIEIGTKVKYAKMAARVIVPRTRTGTVKPQYDREFLDDNTNKWFDDAVRKARDALADEIKNILTKK